VTRPATSAATSLAGWYRANGRHELPWRASTDRWRVLVSEVMLHQTQVPRVAAAWPGFIGQFPTPDAMAAAGPGAVIAAWGRLGYPRRARWLWEAASQISRDGWPEDLQQLPGVGRYTAAAVAAQADGDDSIGIEVNIRRVCERVDGSRLSQRDAEQVAIEVARPLRGRDRLLALMDLGAIVCTARAPACDRCPLGATCATRGVHAGETRHRQGRFEGSFRQRRGLVMARLRAGSTPTADLDGEALASLLDDGLAEVTRGRAHLPRAPRSSAGGRAPTR
jgi:A/G-specific adenine glycosylase